MFAITFRVDEGTPLTKEQEEEIASIFEKLLFRWHTGNSYGGLYLADEKNPLACCYEAINKLSRLPWLKESIEYLGWFRVEDLTNFTKIIKEPL